MSEDDDFLKAPCPINISANVEYLSPISSPTSAQEDVDATLQLHIEKQDDETILTEKRGSLLVVAADKSASMRNAWEQVQSALLYIFHHASQDPNIKLEVILYNQIASRLSLTEENHREIIFSERAIGQTCFAACFDLINDTVRYEVSRSKIPLDVTLLFQTDGCHTSPKNALVSFKNLQKTLRNLPEGYSSSVHCIGFTSSHKFTDLDQIRKNLGKKEGTFQYAEPSDGPNALQKKLEAVFDLISVSQGNLDLDLRLDGFQFLKSNKFVDNLKATVRLGADGTSNEFYGLYLKGKSVGKTVVDNPEDSETNSLHIEVNFNGVSYPFSFPLSTLTKKSSLDPTSLAILSKFRRLRVILDNLLYEMSTHTSAPPPEIREKYASTISYINQEMNSRKIPEPALFKLSRTVRTQTLEMRQGLNVHITQILETLASWGRGEWNNVTRARLADITYSNLFTKNNRKRRMDARVASNSAKMKEDNARLEALSLGDLPEISGASSSLFNCVLTLSDWAELLGDKDVTGFGVAVGRPEWVFDDPTQLRIFDISSTFFSKTALEDAIAASIDIQGHIKTLGGFGVDLELGVATRGRGREPINAWLPLYLHEKHWEVASILIRQIIAYFVTLDPLGFIPDQVDTLFLVLGTMVGRLGLEENGVGERQLLLLYQFQRTCLELARHFNWEGTIRKRLNFILNSSHYDLTDQPKNLLVLVGYLLILGENGIKEFFPTSAHWNKFWLALLAIASRRSAFIIFSEFSETQIGVVVEQILYGDIPKKEAGSSSSAITIRDSSKGKEKDNGASKNENAQAFDVAKYINDYYIMDQVDVNEFDPNSTQPNTFKTISTFETLMNQKGYPTIRTLLSALVFTTKWYDMVLDFSKNKGDVNNNNNNNDEEVKNETKNGGEGSSSGNKEGKESILRDKGGMCLEELDKNFGVASDKWLIDMKDFFIHALDGVSKKEGKSHDERITLENFLKFACERSPFKEPVYNHAPYIQTIRALVTQGILYRVNKTAHAILDGGTFTDTFNDPNRCLGEVHVQIHKRRTYTRESIEKAAWFERATKESVLVGDLSEFVEQIKKTLYWTGCASRWHSHFRLFYVQFQQHGADKIPYAIQKLRVIVGGKFPSRNEDGTLVYTNVFDNGVIWLPGKMNNSKFRRIFGKGMEDVLQLALLDHKDDAGGY